MKEGQNSASVSGMFQRTLGGYRKFYKNVALPQSFVFVLLTVACSFLKEDIAAYTITYLSVICYILLFNSIGYFSRAELTLSILAYEIAGIFLLLFLFAAHFLAEPLLSFYLPVVVVMLALRFVDLSLAQGALLLGLCAATLALFWWANYFLAVPWLIVGLEGGGLLLLGGVLLLIKPYRSDASQGHAEQLAGDDLDFDSETASGQDSAIDHWSAQRQTLYDHASQVLCKELCSEFSWRLGIISLFSAAVVLGLAFLGDFKDRVFAGCWLLVACVNVIRHHAMLTQRNLLALYRNAFFVFCTALLWWSMLPIFNLADELFIDFWLGILVLVFGFLPWPGKYILLLSLCMFGLGGFRLAAAAQPILPTLVFATILVLSVRNAMLVRLSILTRISALLMSGWRETVSTIPVLHVLSWQMAELASARCALMIYGTERAEIIEGQRARLSTVDKVFVQGLIQKVNDAGMEGGVVHKKDLDRQFVPALNQWFVSIPARLFFVRLRVVVDEQEQNITIFVPVSFWVACGGLHKVFTGILTISSIARMWVSAARTRFLSSDALLTTQRSISEREYELNQVIHKVNNVAQDISIQCGNIRAVIEGGQNESDASHGNDEILKQVSRAELSARHLSSSVSDVKLLKELLRIKNFDRTEHADVTLVLDEMQGVGQYYAYRFGSNFALVRKIEAGVEVLVASKEFLETALRLCIKVATRQHRDQGEVQLAVSLEEDMVVFRISDNGEELEAQAKAEILSMDNYTVACDTDYLKAIVNLARLSNGVFSFPTPSDRFTNCMQLALPVTYAVRHTKKSEDGWVLLVDDNAEVTTFYARVAEALELTYFTAASVQEAQAYIDSHGRPKLVITDIQLTDGSGIDLVKSIRKEFGSELPVIVVSGNTESSVVDEVREVQANKYLTKPVGRRKLFAEIQEILGEKRG
ncbi:response regulator [Oligoflexia bacterium]|nr:response regulator [Oligoflexia bacterium]